MTFYDSASPAVQPGQAHRSLLEDLPRADNLALERRQDLETYVFTTTAVVQAVVATSSPLPDGFFTQVDVVEAVTQVITSSVLVSSPSSTPESNNVSSLPPSSTPTPVPTATSTSGDTPPTAMDTAAASNTLQAPASDPTSTNVAASNKDPVSTLQHTGATPRGFPAGAIAGIVIGAVVVINLIGIFFYRRYQLAKRRRRRATWKAGMLPKSKDLAHIEKAVEHPAVLSPFMLGMPGTSQRSANDEQRQSVYSLPSALARSPAAVVARDEVMSSRGRSASPSPRGSPGRTPLRPARSQNRMPRKSPKPIDEDDAPASSAALATPLAAQVPTAIVRVTFIPTRPDELSISIGQTLAVLHRFDDGWALCANAYGEQGMVPLECLEGGGGQFKGVKDRSAMMQSSARRRSSLYPPTSTSSQFARP